MKVLVLSKYDRLAASARYRFLQYAPYLEAHGIELVLSPLFDDAYLTERFETGRASPWAVLRGYQRRLKAVLAADQYDVALMHYELFPYLPGVLERALSVRGVPYVYDFDDATFHMYDQHRLRVVRTVLGTKLAPALAGAGAVMAGSRYLADYAKRYSANVHLIPTVVDTDRYAVRPPRVRETGAPFVVGWIGSPSTSAHLEGIAPALTALGAEGPVKLIATGARKLDIPGIEVDIRPWAEDREVADLHEADIGIMPLPDEPWARGKCAFKLIQYMAVGLPTVASPVGANKDVVTPETGLFASTTDAWIDAMRTLRDAPARRHAMGTAGRARAVAAYSLQSQQHRVRHLLENANQ